MDAVELENRSASITDAPPPSLTVRQAQVLSLIVRYQEATGDPCRVSYLARRMDLTRAGVQAHIDALKRKGWLRSQYSPLTLRRSL